MAPPRLLEPNSPQLVLIPVLTSPSGSNDLAERQQFADESGRLRLVHHHQLRRSRLTRATALTATANKSTACSFPSTCLPRWAPAAPRIRTTTPEAPLRLPSKARREPRQPADHEPRIGAIVEWGLALTGVALTVGVVAITVHPSLIEPLGHILGEL